MVGITDNFKVGSFGRVLIRFATSQVISNFMRLIAGFLVVSMLDPKQYGMFTGVGIYLGYFALGHVGVINGLGREFPYTIIGTNTNQKVKYYKMVC